MGRRHILGVFAALAVFSMSGCGMLQKDPPQPSEQPVDTLASASHQSDAEPPVTNARGVPAAPAEADQPLEPRDVADENRKAAAPTADESKLRAEVAATCARIAAKLASVGYSECATIGFTGLSGRSNDGTPILDKQYPPKPNVAPLGRVLLLGGVHGDELTSVSAVFKWMQILNRHHTGKYHWVVAPLVNPDGVLRRHSVRGNANGVDLNRNFPTPYWETRSRAYWSKTGQNPRRYPGPSAASEPETRWTMALIERFKPDVIVSVHAPLKHVDYDSTDRSVSPSRIGNLYRNLMGVYPGSLGNYAGVQRNIPVITLELSHSWIMPKPSVIRHVWTDLVYWLDRHVPDLQQQAVAETE